MCNNAWIWSNIIVMILCRTHIWNLSRMNMMYRIKWNKEENCKREMELWSVQAYTYIYVVDIHIPYTSMYVPHRAERHTCRRRSVHRLSLLPTDNEIIWRGRNYRPEGNASKNCSEIHLRYISLQYFSITYQRFVRSLWQLDPLGSLNERQYWGGPSFQNDISNLVLQQ